MLASDQLKNLLHRKEFTNTDKLLLCLAIENAAAKQVQEIKAIAQSAGLRVALKWNISSLLSRSDGKAVRVEKGWELTTDGRTYVGGLVGPLAATPAIKVASSLRVHLSKIKNKDVQSFVEEGIECFERQLYRSSIVLSWIGAMSLLQNHVKNNRLSAFNAEAVRRDPKWRNAKTTDDLGRMKEYDFLQIAESISIIGKSVKQELEKQLKLRNGCGHPSSLQVSENIAAAHMEVLILNVFAKFS